MELRLGTCGWSYADWKGAFYPPGTKDELAFYATHFDAVEIDSTFYRIPSARTVDSWHRRTPDGFVFCAKLLGEITHQNMLEGSDELVSAFLGVIFRLDEKLGPIVVELHPKFAYGDLPKLKAFLAGLPDELRYVVELRHRSWLDKPDVISLLRDLNMGLVMADHPWYPRFEESTTDFAYLRLLGRRDAFPDFGRVHRERDDALRGWVQVLRSLPAVTRRAYVFANNQFQGHSPATISRLRELLEH